MYQQPAVRVYNIEVDQHHNYFAGGYLVHNKMFFDSGSTSSSSTTVTETIYVGSLYEETNGRSTNYIFFGGTRIASVSGDKILYYHNDHLGGTNVLTDDTGAKREVYEYKPFGGYSKQDKYCPIDDPSCESVANYYFTGKPLDEETGLYYYGARYYDPSLGRFITADPTVQNSTSSITFNRYHYAGNNPVNNIDPDGFGFWKKLFKIAGKILLPFVPDKYKGVVIGITLSFINPVLGAIASAAYNTMLYDGSWGDFAKSAGIGILTASIGAGIGDLVGGSLGGFIGAAASGAVAGGVGSVLTGGSFGAGAGQGAIFAAAGYLAVTGIQAAANKIESARLAKAAKEGKVGRTEILQSANSSNNPEEFVSKVDAYVRLNGKEVDGILAEQINFRFPEMTEQIVPYLKTETFTREFYFMDHLTGEPGDTHVSIVNRNVLTVNVIVPKSYRQINIIHHDPTIVNRMNILGFFEDITNTTNYIYGQ